MNPKDIAATARDTVDLLKATLKTFDSFMDHLNNETFKIDPIDLDTLAKKMSSDTDKLIINSEKKEGIVFVGGELSASLLPQKIDQFVFKLKLFFQNAQEKLVLKETEKQLPIKILSDLSLQELKEKGVVTFEVNEPART